MNADAENLAQKGRELRTRRRVSSDVARVRPWRILIGVGVGLLLLLPGFLAFKEFQQWRLRACLPLIDSLDPETSEKGIWKALGFHVIHPDREVTEAIIAAVPRLKSPDRSIIILRIGYWEGRASGREDVAPLLRLLESGNPEDVEAACCLLGRMGRHAEGALPALRAKFRAVVDRNRLLAESLKSAIDEIGRDYAAQ